VDSRCPYCLAELAELIERSADEHIDCCRAAAIEALHDRPSMPLRWPAVFEDPRALREN
jgi:hypothetical protein